MSPICVVCQKTFNEDDEIGAVIYARFHNIPSKRSFAITQPKEYMNLWHIKCAEGTDAL